MIRPRPTTTSILAVAALACAAACVPAPDDARSTLTISVVGTNDLHGTIVGGDDRGGLALFAGYVANLRDVRSRDGGTTLLVDAGDMWQGTLESNLTEGASIVAAYNELGYAAVALGNHEFDFGPAGPDATPLTPGDDPRGALKARASEAAFPLLAANLIDDATGRPVDWPNVSPSAIVDVAGVTVGIIGLMTENAFVQTIASNTVGLSIAPLHPTVLAQSSALRQRGAEIVIVTAHAGGKCTEFSDPRNLSSCDPDAEIFRLAQALPAGGVDLIIGGHAHNGIAHVVNGIPIISSYSSGRGFGRVDLLFDRDAGEVVERSMFAPQPIVAGSYEGKAVVADDRVAESLAPAIAAAETLKARSIGVVLETPFRRGPIPESPIGNLMTDILLDSADGADVAIHNTRGGIRADLPAGALNYGHLFEMFPFDNRVVRLNLSGAALRSVLGNQLQSGRWRGNVSGISVSAQCAVDGLEITMTDTSGDEIRDDDILDVVTTDFLVTGGDNVLTPAAPAGGFNEPVDGPLVRDVLHEWFRRQSDPLHVSRFYDEAEPRWRFPRPLPVDCAGR